MPERPLDQCREFLKDTIRQHIDFSQTDQSRKVAPPPLEKPFAADAHRIKLIEPGQWKELKRVDVATAIKNRRSRREFTDTPLLLEELSFLLWATQGVRQRSGRSTVLRTVPSAGARHALETYLCVFNVKALRPAVYRYLPLEHELLLEFEEPHLRTWLVEATLGQSFVGQAAVTFIWTAVPYRME